MARPALAADRALQVIDLLVAHPSEWFTLAEIARRTDINPASAHALLTVLSRSGYLQRHPARKTYALGPALVASGAAALDQLPSIRAGQAEIAGLSDELGLEVVLTSPTEEEIIVVGTAGHASEFGSVLQVGQRLPLSPPLGSVFLAWSSPEQVERWLARARPALGRAEIEQQHRILQAVRSRGYSIGLESPARRGLGDAVASLAPERSPLAGRGTVEDLLAALSRVAYQLTALDERRTYDVSMIAAPVFDANRNVAVAITVSGLAPAVPAADIISVAERVRGAALVITKRARGRLPEDG
jgi:DNA-binding IclR family transcriptional regulator